MKAQAERVLEQVEVVVSTEEVVVQVEAVGVGREEVQVVALSAGKGEVQMEASGAAEKGEVLVEAEGAEKEVVLVVALAAVLDAKQAMIAVNLRLGTDFLVEHTVGVTAESAQVRLQEQGAVVELGVSRDLQIVEQIVCTSVGVEWAALQSTSSTFLPLSGSHCRMN